MGIDCKELYQIVHYGSTKDIDDYCQETGRAGRDEKLSHAVLLLGSNVTTRNQTDGMKNAEVSLMALDTPVIPSSRPRMFIVDDDGLDFLKSKLQELRANLCDGYTFLHTGFDIATGFPLQTIDDIVHSVDYIGNEEQIKNEFVLFNTNLSSQVYSIIQDIQLHYGNEVPFPGEIEDIKGSADSLIVDSGSDFDDKSESSDSSACSDYSVKMRSKYRSVILSDTDDSQEF
eukprot:gene2778-3215_t